MESLGGSILPEPGGTPDAETLVRLRHQRRLLGDLRDGVDTSGRRVAAREVGLGWRSPAERAYRDRLTELTAQLQSAWRSLDDAMAAVDEAIDRVRALL